MSCNIKKHKIKWNDAMEPTFRSAKFLGLNFTLSMDPLEMSEGYIVETSFDDDFSRPLFEEIKAIDVKDAKKKAEQIILYFVFHELKRLHEGKL